LAYNVKIKKHSNWFGPLEFPVTSATAIEVGDFVAFDGTDLELVDAVTDDNIFLGVAGGKSLVGSTSRIPVYIQCVCNGAVASSTYAFGDGLKFNATNNNLETDGADGATEDTIAHVFEYKSGTITDVNFMVDIINLGGGNVDNGSAAKLWNMAGISA